MPLKCCVPGCKANYGGEYVAVFHFPRDETLKREWLRQINRTDYVVTRNSTVCIRHFSPDVVRNSGSCSRITNRSSLAASKIRHTLTTGAIPSLAIGEHPAGSRGLRRFNRISGRQIVAPLTRHAASESVPVSDNIPPLRVPPGLTVSLLPPPTTHVDTTEVESISNASSNDVKHLHDAVKIEHRSRHVECHRRAVPVTSLTSLQHDVTVRPIGRLTPSDDAESWTVEVEQAPCFMVSTLEEVAAHLQQALPLLRDWTYLLKPNKLVIMKVCHEGGAWPPQISRSIVLWPDMTFSLYDDRRRLSRDMLNELDVNFETVIQNHDVDFLIECVN